jgi:hypothetical protein
MEIGDGDADDGYGMREGVRYRKTRREQRESTRAKITGKALSAFMTARASRSPSSRLRQLVDPADRKKVSKY